MRAGSIRGVALDDHEHGFHKEDSVFFTPVPTKGSPTEVLAERFQSTLAFVTFVWHRLTFESVAQVPQGPHRLLPRGLHFV